MRGQRPSLTTLVYLSMGCFLSSLFKLLCNYIASSFMPPTAAKKGKRVFWGHPKPRQRTASSALLFFLRLRREREKEFFGSPLVHPPDARAPKTRQRTASSALLLNSYSYLM